MDITRRKLLKQMGVGTLAFVGGQFVASKFMPGKFVFAADADSWKQFAGTKLTFLGRIPRPRWQSKRKSTLLRN